MVEERSDLEKLSCLACQTFDVWFAHVFCGEPPGYTFYCNQGIDIEEEITEDLDEKEPCILALLSHYYYRHQVKLNRTWFHVAFWTFLK